jgi:hypothetical protein
MLELNKEFNLIDTRKNTPINSSYAIESELIDDYEFEDFNTSLGKFNPKHALKKYF